MDEHDNIGLGFSRDGFHFTRSTPAEGQQYREPFIAEACPSWTAATAASDPGCRNSSRWNFVNVQPTGGGFMVFEDEIRFYVSGRRPNGHNTTKYSNGHAEIAAGIARLRRDGFASFSTPSPTASAVVTTHPLNFSGSFLFVNVKIPAGGSLHAEVLDAEADGPVSPWGAANSSGLRSLDSTKARLKWADADGKELTLSAAAGTAVRLRFLLSGGAELYSFWVSRQECGASGGPVGAGSADFPLQRDIACKHDDDWTSAAELCPAVASSESGWVTVGTQSDAEAKAWWWYFPHPSPEPRPLLLWLIGGPGGSGARDAVYQAGVCSLEKNGSLVPNPESIGQRLGVDVLYLDEWEWAGYSGGGLPVATTANQTAARIYQVLGAWLKAQGGNVARRDLYIMGYSACGQYLPVVAVNVLEGNLPVRLRGIAMGNGLIDPLTQIPTWGPYLYANKLMNKSTLALFDEEYRQHCEPALLKGDWQAAADSCWNLSNSSFCTVPDSLNIRSKTPFVSNPPEFLKFFRSEDVKRRLHAQDAPSNWTCFNSTVYPRFTLDLVRSYKWAMERVLSHSDVKVLVYSGVLDVHYNYLALDAWTRSMEWAGSGTLRAAELQPWRPSAGDSSWGEFRRAGQLTVLRVANAGHETCRDLPRVCPAFFGDFVLNATDVSATPALKTDESRRSVAGDVAWADSFTSHMVLQQLPSPTVLWGFAPPGATVHVHRAVGSAGTPAATGTNTSDSDGVWWIALPGLQAGNETFAFSGNASSSGQTLTLNALEDVVYGDVWLCSGQSNVSPCNRSWLGNAGG